MQPETLQRLIEAAKKKAGSRNALARVLGVAAPTIIEWEEGGGIKSTNADALRAFLGEDSSLAPRADNTEVVAAIPQYAILGEVAAGACVELLSDPVLIDGPRHVWQRSTLWAHGTGPTHYLRVRGDSMDPEWPDGTLVAVRAPATPIEMLPDLAPVVFADQLRPGEHTFKLLQVEYAPRDRAKVRAILGIPVNRTHRTIVWRPGEVSVKFLVVGAIHPVVTKSPSLAMAPMFRDDPPAKKPAPKKRA